ncbi:MAG: undecaprenyl/decaprenyl-phosphate alpha-N-acetylglucosaminyl 1-phosphate transferase [Deltaproteobacteria bacterium]|nr:undecaprenyl/decaprenyl-phosphate alpha-N-acetylglucosaminyl 1-phosphate transferase [Deltaproteobacteria bacterium]
MLTYVVAFALAMAVAAGLTPLVARLAYVVGAVDHPGEARKIHTRAIPRIGGVAVVVAFFAPIIGLAIYTNDISDLIYADSRLVSAMILGAAGILALGIYDDIRGADAKLKLAVQVTVAVGLWVAGFRIDLLGVPLLGAVATSYLSLPLTVLWVVGVVNAVNLIDGLDGLASGVALFAAVVLFGLAFVDRAVLLAVFCCALGGAIVGFLFFNFNPAKVFLGDSGSMFLGFVLATISLWTQRKGATAAVLLIPVLALGLPILDTTLSVVRRVGKGQSPFHADREHLHHRLMALGLSHRNAVLTLYTVSGVFALGGLAMLDNDTTRRAIALATVAVVVLILVRHAGVFSIPKSAPALEPTPSALRDLVREAARQVRGADRLDQAFNAVSALLPRLGCSEARLSWALEPDLDSGRETVFRWRSRSDDPEWKLDGPMGPYETAIRMALQERGTRFGDFTILRDRDVPRSRAGADEAVVLEILRDALIDFGIAQRAAAEARLTEALSDRVVRIPVEHR